MLRVQSWYNALSQLFRTCTLLASLILRTGTTDQSRTDECHHFKDEWGNAVRGKPSDLLRLCGQFLKRPIVFSLFCVGQWYIFPEIYHYILRALRFRMMHIPELGYVYTEWHRTWLYLLATWTPFLLLPGFCRLYDFSSSHHLTLTLCSI